MDLESVTHSEVSQKEENKYHILTHVCGIWGFPGATSGEELTCQCRTRNRCGLDSRVGEDHLEEGIAIHSNILVWRFHGQRSLVDYSPGVTQSRTGQKWLKMHYSHRLVPTQSHLGLSIANVVLETIFGIVLLWDWNETDLFHSSGHWWVFQIWWHIECSTVTA